MDLGQTTQSIRHHGCVKVNCRGCLRCFPGMREGHGALLHTDLGSLLLPRPAVLRIQSLVIESNCIPESPGRGGLKKSIDTRAPAQRLRYLGMKSRDPSMQPSLRTTGIDQQFSEYHLRMILCPVEALQYWVPWPKRFGNHYILCRSCSSHPRRFTMHIQHVKSSDNSNAKELIQPCIIQCFPHLFDPQTFWGP